MAVPTKADIQTELKQARVRMAEMEKELKQARTETMGFARRDAGWLVTAPNIMFSGQKYNDVTFLYGMTFIRANQMVPYFQADVIPMTKASIDAFLQRQMPIPPHTPEDHRKYAEAYAARQDTAEFTTAFKAVTHLHADFGYKVEWYEPDQIDELEAKMKERELEARGIMQEEYQDLEQAKKIIKPGFFGQPV